MESVSGMTIVHLCSTWPQGLRRLLETRAKNLIDLTAKHMDSRPITTAVSYHCTESVDLLMRAGCNWNVSDFRAVRSNKCAAVIASHLADRMRHLFELAQRELGTSHHIRQHDGSENVPDSIAAGLCYELRAAGVSIPSHLRLQWSNTTIYHHVENSICHFPIYSAKGFGGYKSYDAVGRTPVMIWRDIFRAGNYLDPRKIWPAFLWLRRKGCLDQKPQDPKGLGLNVQVTGWHYIAAMVASSYLGRSLQPEIVLIKKIIREFSHIIVRDDCTCWCNPKGKGCSPLTSLWKVHAQSKRRTPYLQDILDHYFFHYEIDVNDSKESQSFHLSLDLVRFLTFEALEMTHTCCAKKTVNLEKNRPWTPIDNFKEHNGNFIIDCNPEKVREIRSDNQEQDNAQLLDTLMAEFSAQIKLIDPSPRALEIFIWGYWRRRISQLFAVNTKEINDMERVVRDVRTRKFS